MARSSSRSTSSGASFRPAAASARARFVSPAMLQAWPACAKASAAIAGCFCAQALELVGGLLILAEADQGHRHAMASGIAAALALPGDGGLVAVVRRALRLRHAVFVLLLARGVELVGACARRRDGEHGGRESE